MTAWKCRWDQTAIFFVFVPFEDLTVGTHIVAVSLADYAGNITNAWWSFTVTNIFKVTLNATYTQLPQVWTATVSLDGLDVTNSSSIFWSGPSFSSGSTYLIPIGTAAGYYNVSVFAIHNGRSDTDSTQIIINDSGSARRLTVHDEKTPVVTASPVKSTRPQNYTGKTFYILTGYIGDGLVTPGPDETGHEAYKRATKELRDRIHNITSGLFIIDDVANQDGDYDQNKIDDAIDAPDVPGSSRLRIVIDRSTTASDLFNYLGRPNTAGVAWFGHGWMEPLPDSVGLDLIKLESRVWTAIEGFPEKDDSNDPQQLKVFFVTLNRQWPSQMVH